MKKQLLTLLLIAIVSVSYGQQTKTITPSLDTVFTTLFPATVTTVVRGYKAPVVVVPPVVVTPPVITGTLGSAGTHAVINLSGASNQTIAGYDITGGSSPCITLNNCSGIHITLCRLHNSTSGNGALYLINCQNITIDNNFFTVVATGVYATNTTKGGLTITNNQFLNMMGPFPRGQYVQLNTVSGPNILIKNNKCQNIIGQSYAEDNINIYMSNGTASSPITIDSNQLLGGGPSPTGGSIMLGDNGGSWQVASNNTIVNPGQYGMAIAGGTNISIVNNNIYAAKNTFTNVGLYTWNQSSGGCSNNTASGNQVNWTNKSGVANPFWDNGNCGPISGWNTNNWAANIDASIIPLPLITMK